MCARSKRDSLSQLSMEGRNGATGKPTFIQPYESSSAQQNTTSLHFLEAMSRKYNTVQGGRGKKIKPN